MPRCTNCGAHARTLVRREQGVTVLERCDVCNLHRDPYLENSSVQLAIDVFLLRPAAWVHVVHNAPIVWRNMLLVVCCAVLAETYVATMIEAYSDMYDRHHHHPSSGVAVSVGSTTTLPMPTLKLVDNLQSSRLHLWHLRPLLEMFCYGVLEFVFVTLCLMWAGSWLTVDVVDPVRGTLGLWFGASTTTWALKILFTTFFVWDIPLYLVQMVDLLSLLWLLQAVRTVAPRATVTSAVVVCAVAVGARFAFRGVTRWCPLFITADLLMPVIG